MLINNRYQIQKRLGRGGFGQTYLAFDTQCFNHPCVLKEFAPASRAEYAVQKARELFEREARILYEIKHPQIPQFLAWFIDRGRLFLVQEYIAGKTYAQLLRERQQQGQAFSEAEILRWLTDLLPVLDYLHQRQIVHRDISPDNLMLPNQSNARPVLIDFGLVKQTLSQIYVQTGQPNHPSALESASFVGKFGYAPPEQIRMGQCFPSSDLYALGVTTLVLLTGQEPQTLMDQESLEWQWRDYATVSDSLAQVLARLLHEKPKARYQTAQEVLTALRTVTAPVPKFNLLAEPVAFAPTQTEAAELDAGFLQRCQQELMNRIGPIANFVLENTLAQHPNATPMQLIQALTLEILDPAQAAAFKTCLTNELYLSSPAPSPTPSPVASPSYACLWLQRLCLQQTPTRLPLVQNFCNIVNKR
ncbi:MAG: serine/threonine protein kinase [Cyanobacteria bacterium RM1_2_2]|nr:serine/threonine protein kinase [Cyanobacteria bacterium RM1_2_2]